MTQNREVQDIALLLQSAPWRQRGAALIPARGAALSASRGARRSLGTKYHHADHAPSDQTKSSPQ
jgi:hypothetical protein